MAKERSLNQNKALANEQELKQNKTLANEQELKELSRQKRNDHARHGEEGCRLPLRIARTSTGFEDLPLAYSGTRKKVESELGQVHARLRDLLLCVVLITH